MKERHELIKTGNYTEADTNLSNTLEWEKKRIQEARLETVSEKSAVEGRNEVGWKILEDRRLSWVPLFVTSALSNLRVEFLTQSIQLVMRLALLAAVS